MSDSEALVADRLQGHRLHIPFSYVIPMIRVLAVTALPLGAFNNTKIIHEAALHVLRHDTHHVRGRPGKEVIFGEVVDENMAEVLLAHHRCGLGHP